MTGDNQPASHISGEALARLAGALTEMHDDEAAGFANAHSAIARSQLVGWEPGAVRNAGHWWMVLARSADDWLSDASAPAIAICDTGDVVDGSWDDVRQTAGLALQRDASFFGEAWLRWLDFALMPPFHLDADTWEGAICGGDNSTFTVTHEGEPCSIEATEHALWGGGPPGVRAGTWISASGEYAGASVQGDSNGCLWGVVPEFGSVFLGRPASEVPSPANLLSEVVDALWAGGEFEISSLSSDFLTDAELAEFLALVDSLDPNFDADDFVLDGVESTRIDDFDCDEESRP